MVLALAACGPDSIVLDTGLESSSGAATEATSTPTGETQSDPAESESGDEANTGSEGDDETETGEEESPPPEYEADGCEVEVLWSHRSESGQEFDRLTLLEYAGPGRFVVAGGAQADSDRDFVPDTSASLVLGVEDGETSWTQLGQWQEGTSGPVVSSLLLAGSGDVYTIANGSPSFFAPQRLEAFSPTGEALFVAETEDSHWDAMAWLEGELLVLGRTAPGLDEDVNTTTIPLSFARFDPQLELLAVDQAGYDDELWTLLEPSLLVEDDRISVGAYNYDDGVGVVVEFDASGQQIWLSANGDQVGASRAIARLGGGALVSAGTLESMNLFLQGLSGWTGAGASTFTWQPGPDDIELGGFNDIEPLADGGFVAVGIHGSSASLRRFDAEGQQLSACNLSRAGVEASEFFTAAANFQAVEIGPQGQIYALLYDPYPELPAENTIVELTL